MTPPGKRLKRLLIDQFKHPTGILGRVAGIIMANRESNRRRSQWTVELLDIGATDRILEIGFGPGLALGYAAAKATAGYVVGVDHSLAMHHVASARNRRVIRDGKMALYLGTAEELDEMLDRHDHTAGFHHIFAVNVALFWDDPVRVLQSLARHLAPSGQIALTLQPRLGDAGDDASINAGDRIQEQMQAAGLQHIRVEYLRELSPMVVCVIARKFEALA